MADPTNHDLLRDLIKDVQYVKQAVDELREGKAGVCMKHTSEIVSLRAEVDTLFSRQWKVLISVAFALLGALIGIMVAAKGR